LSSGFPKCQAGKISKGGEGREPNIKKSCHWEPSVIKTQTKLLVCFSKPHLQIDELSSDASYCSAQVLQMKEEREEESKENY